MNFLVFVFTYNLPVFQVFLFWALSLRNKN
jgi:hypothetical protein